MRIKFRILWTKIGFVIVDARLPGAVETMLQNIWVVMFAFLIITLVFPWFVVPLLVLIVLYYFITKIFRYITSV